MKEPASKKTEKIQTAPEALPPRPGPGAQGQARPGAPGSSGPGGPAPAEEINKFDPRKLIGLVVAYWWLITLFVLLGAGAGAAYCVLGTPKFRAACQYQIFMERVLRYGVETTLEQQTREFGRQMTLLQSDLLRSRVKNKLAPEWENRLVETLDVAVSVVKDRRRPVLTIFVDAANEEYAQAFLRELIASYEEMRKLEEMDATERSLRTLRLEKDRLATELQDARERQKEFQERHNLRMAQSRSEFEEKRLDRMMERSNALRMESSMIETQLAALEQADTATISNVYNLTMETHALTSGNIPAAASPTTVAAGADAGSDGTPVRTTDESMSAMTLPTLMYGADKHTQNWEQHEERLARLEAMYNDKLKHYQPGHPAMDLLKQNIAQVQKDIEFESELARRRLQARYDALKIQQEALELAIGSWRNEYNNLTIAEVSELQGIRGEVERLDELVTTLADKIIDVASKSSEMVVTQQIAEPRGQGKVWPKPLVVMGASTGGAAGVGLALALAFFFLDTRFTDAIAIEHRLNLPFISGIPRWERVIKDLDPDVSIVMDKEHANAVSESYRCLRVNLEKSIGEEKGYSLMLTSADAGEGKSITASNLGIAFAWTGRKVLLIDADLRRPNLHNALGLKSSQVGFTQFLLGEVTDWRQLVQKTDFDNVDLIQAGKFLYEAPELCSPSRLRGILAEMAENYDMIILDTAPVGRIVDTAIMARACDGIMFVSLHGKTSLPAMRHSLKRLEGTNVLGFCLNAIDMPRGHGYYYGGYYNYRWQYGLYSYYYYYSTSLYGYDYNEDGYDYGYGYSGYGRRHQEKEQDAEEEGEEEANVEEVSNT